MNNARLLQLADFLQDLPAESFTLAAWVVTQQPVQDPLVSRLPAGSRACPIGWLPSMCPSDWCWLALPDDLQDRRLEVYPVYKASVLWLPEEHDTSQVRTSTWHVQHRTWAQVHEWFDIQNKTLLDALFSAEAYKEERQPDVVAARLRQAAKHVLQDTADEITLAQKLQ